MVVKTIWNDEQLDENDDPSIKDKSSSKSTSSQIDGSEDSVGKPNYPSQTLGDRSGLLSIKRLIVVVPDEEVNEAQLSRQIWNLADNYSLDVLLISLVVNYEGSLSALRRLTTIAAMTRASHFKVEKRVVYSKSWDRALRPFYQQTDLILCPSEKTIPNLFGKMLPLSQVLSDTLKVPVYSFSGSFKPPTRQMPYWMR